MTHRDFALTEVNRFVEKLWKSVGMIEPVSMPASASVGFLSARTLVPTPRGRSGSLFDKALISFDEDGTIMISRD